MKWSSSLGCGEKLKLVELSVLDIHDFGVKLLQLLILECKRSLATRVLRATEPRVDGAPVADTAVADAGQTGSRLARRLRTTTGWYCHPCHAVLTGPHSYRRYSSFSYALSPTGWTPKEQLSSSHRIHPGRILPSLSLRMMSH